MTLPLELLETYRMSLQLQLLCILQTIFATKTAL